MKKIIINVMNSWSHVRIALLIDPEHIFPLIPSEEIFIFCGFMTIYTKMKIIGVIISSYYSMYSFYKYKISSNFLQKYIVNLCKIWYNWGITKI